MATQVIRAIYHMESLLLRMPHIFSHEHTIYPNMRISMSAVSRSNLITFEHASLEVASYVLVVCSSDYKTART